METIVEKLYWENSVFQCICSELVEWELVTYSRYSMLYKCTYLLTYNCMKSGYLSICLYLMCLMASRITYHTWTKTKKTNKLKQIEPLCKRTGEQSGRLNQL